MSGSRIRLTRHWAPLTLAEDTLPAVLQEVMWCTRRLSAQLRSLPEQFALIEISQGACGPDASQAYICIHPDNDLCDITNQVHDSDKRVCRPVSSGFSRCSDWRPEPETSWPTENQLHVSSWWTAVWKGTPVSCKCAKVLTSLRPTWVWVQSWRADLLLRVFPIECLYSARQRNHVRPFKYTQTYPWTPQFKFEKVNHVCALIWSYRRKQLAQLSID